MNNQKAKSIAFDVTQANDPRRTGIGRVVEEQVRSICWLIENGLWPFGKLTLLSAWPFRLSEALMQSLKTHGVKTVVLPFSSMYVYRITKLSYWVWRNKPDVLFIPEPIYPGFVFKSRLAVMHYDLLVRQSPKTLSWHIRLLYKLFFNKTLQRAKWVGVDSEFVREQTAAFLPGFLEKSQVLPIYLKPAEQPESKAPESCDPKARFALFVGNLMPHKNIRRLLDAFEHWQEHFPDEFIPLYLVGRVRPEIDDLRPRLSELQRKGTIQPFGYLQDSERTWLLEHATFFAFPSLIEGYGLPIMEAMACNCPVLTSDGGATEETAGGAAYLVDPLSTESLLEGIRQLAGSDQLRRDLIEKGAQHAARFTREFHATNLSSFLQQVLK